MNAFEKTRRISFDDAKVKAAAYCAYQERCQQEVRDKLYSYGLHREEVEELISFLITEGFVNEERFARAYAGGKFRIKKWGKLRIARELKSRKLSDACINKGLEEIDHEEYVQTIDMLIRKKDALLKHTDVFVRKKKLAEFLIRKGYEPPLVWERLKEYDQA